MQNHYLKLDVIPLINEFLQVLWRGMDNAEIDEPQTFVEFSKVLTAGEAGTRFPAF